AVVLAAALAQDPPAATPAPRTPGAAASSNFATPQPREPGAAPTLVLPIATPSPNLEPQLSPPPVTRPEKHARPAEPEHAPHSFEWFGSRPTERLSLRSAIEQALKNNLEVQFENT